MTRLVWCPLSCWSLLKSTSWGRALSRLETRGARALRDDAHHGVQSLLHRLERRVLRGLDGARQPPVVLLRKEALRHDREQIGVHRDARDGDREHDPPVTQRPRERDVIAPQQAI